jgi:hypothetical protein
MKCKECIESNFVLIGNFDIQYPDDGADLCLDKNTIDNNFFNEVKLKYNNQLPDYCLAYD